MVSMVNQIFQLQKETVSGTAITSAMIRPASLKATPGYATGDASIFKASGYKVGTAPILGSRTGTWNIEGVQDFNALGLVAASVFGPPVTTTPGGGTTSKQHVFTPLANAADAMRTYTAQWGAASPAKTVQATYFVFQSLALQIAYGKLGITSGAISRELDETATLVTAGTTVMPAQIIPPVGYDVYIDDTWAALGTTKALSVYDLSVTAPDKYVMDQPINSTTNGFASLIESDSLAYAVSAQVGFDASGVALVGAWRQGTLKYIRIKVTGPIIEGAIPYSLIYDFCVVLNKADTFTAASGGPVVVIPFSGEMIADPVTGNFAKLTLVNLITAY